MIDAVGKPRHFGPRITETGVTFSVWSPGARKVHLLLDPGTPYERRLSMHPEKEGFFECSVPDVGGGQRYRLQRDDRWPQADPASPFQPDGVFGPSEVIDHSYCWATDDFIGVPLDQLVLYELHVGTFSPEGTYDGIRRRLEHLQELGITGIKLMPIATFAGRHNWGYDGVFHMAPFAPYGRPHQLQALVDACHQRGIAVFVDVVTNHFGPEGNPMWDLARPFFEKHNSTAWGPGPAFGKEPVLAYFEWMARHLRRHYRIDGLRVDAVHSIPAEHRRVHLERLARGLEQEGPPGHTVLWLESIDNEHSALKAQRTGTSWVQLNFDYQHTLHARLTGESHGPYLDAAQAPDEEVCRVLGDGFSFFDRQSLAYGRTVGEPRANLQWSTLVNYLVNHDSAGNRFLGQRLQALVDPDLFRAATALLLLHPAVPYLFAGQEWATTRPFFFFTDFSEELGRKVSKGRRRGFRELPTNQAPRGDDPRAPGPQDPEALTRSRLDWDEATRKPHEDHLAFVTQLLALRRKVRPQMMDNTRDADVRCDGSAQVLSIAHRHGGRFWLVANFGDSPITAPAGKRLYCSNEAPEGEVAARCTALYREDAT